MRSAVVRRRVRTWILAAAAGLLVAAPVAARGPLVDLGVPFYNFVSASSLLLNEGGQPVWVSAAAGYPAILGEWNAQTGKVVATARLPGMQSVYGYAQGSDGTVYLGGSPNAALYSYVPGSGVTKSLGTPDKGGKVIWTLAFDSANNTLYGGLGVNAELFSYQPATATFTNLGSMAPGHAFVRALAVSGGIVYAGLGGSAGLVAFNPTTGAKRQILPAGYARSESVNALQVVGSNLFVHLTDGTELVLDIPSDQLVAHIANVSSPGVSAQTDGTSVAYTSAGAVYEFNLSSHTLTRVSTNLPRYQAQYLTSVSTNAIGLIQVGTNPASWAIVGTASKGTYWLDNPSQGYLASGPIAVNASVGTIESMATGPDGNVYASSYLSGATAVLDPASNTVTVLQGPGQAESMATDGKQLVFGLYPGANLWLYNPGQPWNWGAYATGTENPRLFATIGQQQDRPMSMVAGPDGTLYVGTVPQAGTIGGALSTVSPSGQVTTYRNLIPNQSPISLVWDQGSLVGATTVSGGIGGRATAKSAQLFVWNPTTDKLVSTLTPFPNVPAIAGLAVGPNGTVYGLTNTQIFAYSPATNSILATTNLPWTTGTGYGSFDWGSDASLVFGADGNLYGSIDGRAFEAQPRSALAVTTLVASGVHLVTVAPDGQLFVVGNSGTHLEELAFPATAPN